MRRVWPMLVLPGFGMGGGSLVYVSVAVHLSLRSTALQLLPTPFLLLSNLWKASCFLILSNLPNPPSALTYPCLPREFFGSESLLGHMKAGLWVPPLPKYVMSVSALLWPIQWLKVTSELFSGYSQNGKEVCALTVYHFLLPHSLLLHLGPRWWEHLSSIPGPGRVTLISSLQELSKPSLQ